MIPDEASMRERIARAICNVANASIGMKPDEGEWVTYLDMADAVLAAMREPTEAMKLAGDAADYDSGERAFATAHWQAMVDAARGATS